MRFFTLVLDDSYVCLGVSHVTSIVLSLAKADHMATFDNKMEM